LPDYINDALQLHITHSQTEIEELAISIIIRDNLQSSETMTWKQLAPSDKPASCFVNWEVL
jgi:hypothetical protein